MTKMWMGTAAAAAAILLAGCGGGTEEPVAEAPSPTETQEEASPSPSETSAAAATTSNRATSTYRAPAPVEEAPAARETSEEPEEEEEPEEQESASRGCEAAFGNAQRALERAGTLSFDDVRPAMMACQSMDDWVLGAQAYPEVLGENVDPVTYATNQCQYDAQYRDAAVCEDVSGS